MEREPSEYELALRARDGDPEALAELVERVRLRLFALAFAELRHYDDAQDAVASALLQTCLHVGSLREPERIRAWMQQIVRNEAHRLRRGIASEALPLLETDAVDEGVDLSVLRLDVERALRRLPGDQAVAIRLFFLEGRSLDEIARRLGRSIGTVGSWLHRGRRRLATELEEYGPMKRREALKLLAVTPMLATTLEEGTPMRPGEQEATPQTAPARAVVIVHTDLEPALVRVLEETFQKEGYSTNVTAAGDLSRLTKSLREHQVIILDEWIGGRPALELLLNIRATPETNETPIGVLYGSQLPEIAWRAYFIGGANRMADKRSADDLAGLARSMHGVARDIPAWLRYTGRAREVLDAAQDEATRLGENSIGVDHLLLGLIAVSLAKGSIAGNILQERLGIPLGELRDAHLEQVGRGTGYLEARRQLTPEAERVCNYHAYSEARELGDRFVGTEHQLLGVIREGNSRAARLLISRGADLERTREAVQSVRAEEATAHGA
jgi:RNA polymerase sigma factor (sigma-70 family)